MKESARTSCIAEWFVISPVVGNAVKGPVPEFGMPSYRLLAVVVFIDLLQSPLQLPQFRWAGGLMGMPHPAPLDLGAPSGAGNRQSS